MRLFYFTTQRILFTQLLSLCLLCLNVPVTADNSTEISTVQGNQVTIPKVEVGTDIFLNARLEQHADNLWYFLGNESQTPLITHNTTTAQFSNNILHIPFVKVGEEYYTVQLTLVGDNPYRFSLLSYSIVQLPVIAQQIYLLLHGMSADQRTWNRLIKETFFGNGCPAIIDGNITEGDPAHVNYNCFRLRFGKTERLGLEGVTTWDYGDGATFSELGQMVNKAVERIVQQYPNALITLVGHSRGGLAARAFLQDAAKNNTPFLPSINGLLTIGTPHQGSPFGRIYNWLEQHPRQDSCSWLKPFCNDDWQAVDFIREASYLDPSSRIGTDARAPTIKFLDSDSEEIKKLNAEVGFLNLNIKFAQLISTQVKFGDINEYYDVFGNNIGHHPSNDAKDYLLNGHNKEDYQGDGIVPTRSQQINQIPNFPVATVLETEIKSYVRHDDETDLVVEIVDLLKKMAVK